MLIRKLTGMTLPHPPTLAEIEQQREELLTQVDLPSRHSTGPADPDPASPPITAQPTPETAEAKNPPAGNLVRIVRTC